MTYEAAVAAIPTVKHVQDLVDSIPQVSCAHDSDHLRFSGHWHRQAAPQQRLLPCVSGSGH